MSAMSKSPHSYSCEYFARPTVIVASELIGKTLCRRFADGRVLTAPIVEVEAYTMDDPACHASRGQTPRCRVMFGPAGKAYVYFIYGMYFCLNVVTEPEGTAGAVLIRAIGTEGGEGPGKLCRTWNITREHNGIDLTDPDGELWIAPAADVSSEEIGISIRVGISVAQDRPWRFFLKDSPHVSVKSVKPHMPKKRKAKV
jgi:DNA-3-methyladenine glycosylase